MQQTQKYKLNLIESSDPFLPEGLNENTQKVEDVLAAREALSDERLADMDQRVTVLEGHKVLVGEYTGNGNSGRVIKLGVKPKVVVLYGTGNVIIGLAGLQGSITLTEDGFKCSSYNGSGYTYRYFSIS